MKKVSKVQTITSIHAMPLLKLAAATKSRKQKTRTTAETAIQKSMARGERLRSSRCIACSPLPLKAAMESRIPSTIGLNRVISVQIAAMAIVPAPIKRTLFFHSPIA